MSMRISNYGNTKVNFNNQKQNPSFGSKVVIDDIKAKREIKGDFPTGNSGSRPIEGMSIKKVPPKANFSEEIIDKLKARLVKVFAKNGQDNTVEIALKSIENLGEKNNEYIKCSMKIGEKSQDFIGMAPIKGFKKSSLVRNAVNVYDRLVNGEKPEIPFVPTFIKKEEKGLVPSNEVRAFADELIGKRFGETVKNVIKLAR